MGQGWLGRRRGRVKFPVPSPPPPSPPRPPSLLRPPNLGEFGGGLGGRIRGLGEVLEGPGLGPAPPPPLATPPPPNSLGNFSILAYLLEILVIFCEIFLYLKLKWSSLDSPLGFSFYENLMTI
jgi:hypothetical protein